MATSAAAGGPHRVGPPGRDQLERELGGVVGPVGGRRRSRPAAIHRDVPAAGDVPDAASGRRRPAENRNVSRTTQPFGRSWSLTSSPCSSTVTWRPLAAARSAQYAVAPVEHVEAGLAPVRSGARSPQDGAVGVRSGHVRWRRRRAARPGRRPRRTSTGPRRTARPGRRGPSPRTGRVPLYQSSYRLSASGPMTATRPGSAGSGSRSSLRSSTNAWRAASRASALVLGAVDDLCGDAGVRVVLRPGRTRRAGTGWSGCAVTAASMSASVSRPGSQRLGQPGHGELGPVVVVGEAVDAGPHQRRRGWPRGRGSRPAWWPRWSARRRR